MQEWAAQILWRRLRGDRLARSSAAQPATAPAEMTTKRVKAAQLATMHLGTPTCDTEKSKHVQCHSSACSNAGTAPRPPLRSQCARADPCAHRGLPPSRLSAYRYHAACPVHAS